MIRVELKLNKTKNTDSIILITFPSGATCGLPSLSLCMKSATTVRSPPSNTTSTPRLAPPSRSPSAIQTTIWRYGCSVTLNVCRQLEGLDAFPPEDIGHVTCGFCRLRMTRWRQKTGRSPVPPLISASPTSSTWSVVDWLTCTTG